MLVVGLIDTQHMQAVIKGFPPPPKIATILVIWKSSDRKNPIKILPVFNISSATSHTDVSVKYAFREKRLWKSTAIFYLCT